MKKLLDFRFYHAAYSSALIQLAISTVEANSLFFTTGQIFWGVKIFTINCKVSAWNVQNDRTRPSIFFTGSLRSEILSSKIVHPVKLFLCRNHHFCSFYKRNGIQYFTPQVKFFWKKTIFCTNTAPIYSFSKNKLRNNSIAINLY